MEKGHIGNASMGPGLQEGENVSALLNTSSLLVDCQVGRIKKLLFWVQEDWFVLGLGPRVPDKGILINNTHDGIRGCR